MELTPTVKLYDENAYETRFTATVVSSEPAENGTSRVWLDRTLFFPEEGGQSPDRGTLNGLPVTDVQITGGNICHTVLGTLSEGTEVLGEIDWKHRFSNMQQHSGEHIFSGLVYHRFGFHNVGFHLSDSCVTMDFDGAFSYETALEIETSVNEVIFGNTPIAARYVSNEELRTVSYRSKKAIDGAVRLVTIYGKPKDGAETVVDICACCAPHVRTTGEIGFLKVVGFENYKGGVRLSILCGMRALMDARAKQEQLLSVSRLVSGSPEQAVERVQQLSDRMKHAEYELERFRREQVMKVTEELSDTDDPILFFEQTGMDALRLSVNRMMEMRDGICAAFSKEEDGYRFLLGSRDGDVRPVVDIFRKQFSGKGGGKPNMAQGSVFGTEEELRAAVKSI